jgi:hypothetical protein
VVATPAQVVAWDVAPWRRHLYVAVNPAELFDTPLAFGLQGVGRLGDAARLYGLLPEGVTLAPRLRDYLTAFFGTEAVRVPRHGYRPVPVTAVFVPVRGGPRPPAGDDVLAVKRQGVHEHPVRNRRLARLARALAAPDRAGLREEFPAVAAHLGKDEMGRVGVLVDDVGHGLRPAAALGWPLVAAEDLYAEGLSSEERALLEGGPPEPGSAEPVVVTAAGLQLAGRLDVLVRADGGPGLPAIPRAKLRVPYSKDCRLLVVDCDDEHHPLLRRHSRQRRDAYREAGWSVAGEESLSPLDHFLATRPEVVA